MLSPRAASAGLAVMTGCVAAVAVVGLGPGALLLALLGLPSGFAAGVALARAAETETETGWFNAARNGFVFVGFGGFVVVGATSLVAALWTPIVTAGTPVVAAAMLSPFGIMVFAAEGGLGAVAGRWVGHRVGGASAEPAA